MAKRMESGPQEERNLPRDGSAAEFSRAVGLSRLDGKAVTCDIEATPAERAALAGRFGLLSLDRLAATVELYPEDGEIRVSGRFAADLTQACIVTLDPVASHLEDEFAVRYTAEAPDARAQDRDIEIPIEEEDPPEPIAGDAIDIGEAVAQQLALALDPYPRCPGASLDALGADIAEEGPARPNPFAVLADLKRKAE